MRKLDVGFSTHALLTEEFDLFNPGDIPKFSAIGSQFLPE